MSFLNSKPLQGVWFLLHDVQIIIECNSFIWRVESHFMLLTLLLNRIQIRETMQIFVRSLNDYHETL